MHLTAKIKIYPTEEQLKVLWELSDKCCSLYNLALAERKDAWRLERKSIKYVDQQNKLPDFKKINPEYKAVYSKANTIIVGDLKIKNMAQSKKLKGKRKRSMNRSTPNQGYLSRFIEFLAYKAELIGKKLIKIDESYTSKTCYVCGKSHDMPLWKRNMECDCGNYIDRDRNSAINIMSNFVIVQACAYRLWSNNSRSGRFIKTFLEGVL